MNNLPHFIWAFTILFIFVIGCYTLFSLSNHPFTLRFEMDDNTLEAIKSINYSQSFRFYNGGWQNTQAFIDINQTKEVMGK